MWLSILTDHFNINIINLIANFAFIHMIYFPYLNLFKLILLIYFSVENPFLLV